MVYFLKSPTYATTILATGKILNKNGQNAKHGLPIPGIEPEPPGWKPGILATRPYGNLHCN